MCNRTRRGRVHEPVRTLANTPICAVPRKAQMQANLSISAMNGNLIELPFISFCAMMIAGMRLRSGLRSWITIDKQENRPNLYVTLHKRRRCSEDGI